ncbi:putative HLA class I histocompatibility antigen, alpha chain [Sesbania bispinosa]|nr:putative HLA class I histocompatibility antigen, alpha chain [Sesbania bispinosa]
MHPPPDLVVQKTATHTITGEEEATFRSKPYFLLNYPLLLKFSRQKRPKN